MAFQSNSQQGSDMPTDKVAVGWIVTQTLIDLKDALKKNQLSEYIALITFLDNFIVQYKDKIYENDIKKADLRGVQINNIGKANDLLRITMKLLQRSNFMPIKTYEGGLVVDIDAEAELKPEDDGQ